MGRATNPILYIEMFGMLSVLLLIMTQKGDAFEFKVGGSIGWALPKDPNTTIYTQWAENNRFQIGDTLLFVYTASHESVLHVTKDDYTNCNIGAPLEKFTDGHTVFKFNQSGPHYFISGAVDNCRKNEKLVVVVMADRSRHESNGTEPPPSPLAPAPDGEESPSLPPSGEAEMNPTPAPSQESTPPRNSGYMNGVSVVSVVVVGFFGSSLFFST